MARWREGRHLQLDGRRLSCWAGLATDRWMFGIVYNTESRTLGFALGPLYAGVGL